MVTITEPVQPRAHVDPTAALIPNQAPAPRLQGHADLTTRPDVEALLLVLCGQATGDVHLDLAELDFIDVSGVISLLRAASTLPPGAHLVLSNPPAAMRRILEVLGPAVAESGVRVD
ncbi:STAS domain-containing protein [Actinokineospora sp. PR83]|uniref:STAS domain-containing protein n=1 Tax=Actinokineospora sp. PR83 TaxID=2884908 RepID=UPI0027DEF2D3|nr:STAS domain-containing protein [Actinokineospora sp. PR83]